MPSSIAAALVLLVAVVPGALGSRIYEAINGLDWRERDWSAAIRFIAFSAVGLTVYVLLADLFRWPPAVHVIPSTYSALNFEALQLPRIAAPFAGHLLSAGFVGLVAAYATRLLSKATAETHRPGAWDAFVRDHVGGRWVVITLKSGDVWAGFLAVGDAGVAHGERDLLLREPARFDHDRSQYVVSPYRDLYLPAELVQNLATVAEPDDGRVGPKPGEVLWGESTHVIKET
jgi:hypothetical protein